MKELQAIETQLNESPDKRLIQLRFVKQLEHCLLQPLNALTFTSTEWDPLKSRQMTSI
jgi:hypothetical protein